MSKPIIEIENISKRYRIGSNKESYLSLRDEIAKFTSRLMSKNKKFSGQDFWALKDVNFSVQEGEAVGIIGRNGAGKSTLLKILSQITPPTEGKITMRGRVASLLEVGTGFHPELTGRENIFLNGTILGMSRREVARKFDEIVAFAEVERFLDTPVKRYSSGMYVRLAFAVAAHLEPEILVVDEVLAVGDEQFQKKCLGKMGEVTKSGRTVLFVSHNMAAVEMLCPKSVLLVSGKVTTVSDSHNVIQTYLMRNQPNRRFWATGPVREASIAQDGQDLVLMMRYEPTETSSIPCLGFVVEDNLGYPLFGTNTRLSKIDSPPLSGKMEFCKIRINSPKLWDGQYYLSLYMGDGYNRDTFSALRALCFNVVHMGPPGQTRGQNCGPMIPICDWSFGL